MRTLLQCRLTEAQHSRLNSFVGRVGFHVTRTIELKPKPLAAHGQFPCPMYARHIQSSTFPMTVSCSDGSLHKLPTAIAMLQTALTALFCRVPCAAAAMYRGLLTEVRLVWHLMYLIKIWRFDATACIALCMPAGLDFTMLFTLIVSTHNV